MDKGDGLDSVLASIQSFDQLPCTRSQFNTPVLLANLCEMSIVRNTFATTTRNFERYPEHSGCQKTPRTNLQTIKAQRTGQERNFMESSDRK